ncbi:twin transmembrane helix small protein [Marinibacterium sp. SX1]|uniref:twin transmembrane helix small protein n=1 Tax=Marinibacterium sp. SX1 TaxID=3388424 RepID=UPI003D1649C9
MTSDPFFLLIVLAVVVTALILALGLGNFARSGDKHGERSNKLMRYRLIAQFVAVVLIAIYVYTKF